ncbi:hypothetical protein FWF48_00625 [Candidatus Saccharibacteria bacterium]|nr:hypothetical protein [Candidatus Saccharibacteria bacterium]
MKSKEIEPTKKYDEQIKRLVDFFDALIEADFLAKRNKGKEKDNGQTKSFGCRNHFDYA